MKKLTLFAIALLASVVSFAALNPYAYGLSSSLSADETTLTINYSLNADATAVNIVVLDGETTVKSFPCEGIAKGTYSVEIPTTEFPKTTALTWKVEVSGASVETPTKHNQSFSFYLPYSMDVDVDTESDYFGRWYVIEATNGGQGKARYHSTSVGRGLYAFDAALNPIKNNSGTYGFTGGMTLGATETNEAGDYINLSCVTTSGGRVFVGRFRSGYAPILEATDLHSTDYPIILSSAGGRAIALDARGSGENLQLVMLGTDYSIKEYDLGVAESWATPATPSRTINTTGLTIERKDAAITYDNEGGLWVNQNSASKPTIAHLSTSGLDYDNISVGLSHVLGAANHNIRGAAVNPEGTELAVPEAGRGKVAVFSISKDAEGKISLTKKYQIATGNNNTALSYDYAGNLYIANRSAETITFFAMPYSGMVATPAASKYAFQLQEGTLYSIIATPNNETMGTVTGAGSYVEGDEVTLTATPKTGHDFVNWSNGETANPLVFTATEDVELTANFKTLQYTVTVGVNDETKGSVTNAGEHTLDYGTELVLKATPAEGYRFAKWSNEKTANPLTITVSGDLEITALFENANITARAWAYDLSLETADDTYTLSFKATTPANATIIFTNAEGEEVGTHELGAIAAGANKISLTTDQLPEASELYWAVKMAYDDVIAIREVTDQSRGIYNFYLPQGVVVDNNPESPTFSKIYIAEATDGASDGGSVRADNQKRGIFIYDQTLAELNPTSNVGIIPSNVTLSTTTRNALKRIAINPKTNEVAFAYNASPAAVWAVSTENVAGDATNLLAGLGFDYCNSLCFDENGILYIFDNGAGYPAKGSLYKIVDGEKTTIFSENSKYGNADNSLASDGRGGLWIAQNRSQLDAYNQLAHVNANGQIDFEVNTTTPHGFASLDLSRGAMAYNPRENVLAIGCGASGTIGVSLYHVTYDPSTGVPSLEFIASTPSLGKNVDGIAFDYAGDLYALSANKERFYKFTLPTNNNTCTTPAPKALVITKPSNPTVLDNTVVAPQVEKIVRNGQVLIIRDGKTFNMMGQEVR